MTDMNKEFWNRMGDVQSGMLGLNSDHRLVPMTPTLDDDPNEVWFITARGTELAAAAAIGAQEARFVVADPKAGLYADIDGTLTLSDDKEKLDEIWSAVASAWFEVGEDDPDVRLLHFAPRTAEAWVTATSGVKFLYEIARGNLTGKNPDVGDHSTLTF